MFDVVVIGGNLAGASAAIYAAQSGVSVALVERNKEPLFPARCGEGITDVTAESLVLDKIGCQQNDIKNVIINVASPKEYTFTLNKHRMIVFDRNYLEKELLKKAEKQGVVLLLGRSMKDFNPPHEIILENHNKIEGRVIIDASGIACQVGRRLGLNTRLKPKDIGVCIQSRVQSDFNADTIKYWYHRPYAPFGYAWLFPLSNALANIGVGIGIGAPGGQKTDLAKLLDIYINDVTQRDHTIINTFRACVPTGPPLKRLFKDNVMIVGDAARLADPLTGGGIGNAFFSGGVAGEIAAIFIHGKISSLKAYEDAMRFRLSRLKKEYAMKVNVFNTEEKLVRNYRMLASVVCFINNLVPSLFQGGIARFLCRDKSILEPYR